MTIRFAALVSRAATLTLPARVITDRFWRRVGGHYVLPIEVYRAAIQRQIVAELDEGDR